MDGFLTLSLEGNPFIIRFKTTSDFKIFKHIFLLSLEGNPFIIRFKTIAPAIPRISFSKFRR